MKGLSLSEPMVIAWHEDRKAVTRRLINPQPPIDNGTGRWMFTVCSSDRKQRDTWNFSQIDESGHLYTERGRELVLWRGKPRYLPGETVYIKEVWKIALFLTGNKIVIQYRADNATSSIPVSEETFNHYRNQKNPYRWRSPMMMPLMFSRSKATIKDNKPERIQEITTGECVKEGFIPKDDMTLVASIIDSDCGDDEIKERFAELWDKLHPGSWDKNEWVFRYELEKVR